MVDSEQFKEQIKVLLSQKYEIEFLGKNFNQIVNLLSDKKADTIFLWIQRVIDKQIQPIVPGSKKPYKDWVMSELLVFRYPFIIGDRRWIEMRTGFFHCRVNAYIYTI